MQQHNEETGLIVVGQNLPAIVEVEVEAETIPPTEEKEPPLEINGFPVEIERIKYPRRYTHEERLELADRIVALERQKDDLELEKKAAADEFNGQIKKVEADIVKVCNDYSNNMTEESVEAFKIKNYNTAQWEYFHPATMELVDVKAFTAADYQTSFVQ